MEKKYSVYVLFSEIYKRRYVGMTISPNKRLTEHNAGKNTSTKAFRPWKIIYLEEFESSEQARKREKYFKTAAGRRTLNKLLNSNFSA